MSTGGDPLPSRALIVAVACLSMAAAASLINVAGSMFGLSRVLTESPLGLATAIGVYGADLFLIMPVAGVLTAALGLVVIHRVSRHGWIWLLLAGTVLPFVLELPMPEGVVIATAGAGSTSLIMGLLGAANWLMHVAPAGTGAAVAGVALAVPLLGGLLAFLVPRHLFVVDSLVTLNRSLMFVRVAAAIGLAAFLPKLLRLPSPPPPTRRVTSVGLIAAVLPLVPNIVLRIGWDLLPPAPVRTNPFVGTIDRWAVLVGVCGLAILATAVALAARVGAKALCAALATGLVLYGVDLPISLIRPPINSSAGTAACTALGLALGIAAAVSRWRAWGAGVACAVTGIAILLVLVSRQPSAAVAGALLSVCVFAAVTTYASAATALAERAQTPAVLGAVAVAIQVGLLLSGALMPNGELAGSPYSPQPLIVAAGVALLVGALFVAALPRIGNPVDQAMLSPELPVAR